MSGKLYGKAVLHPNTAPRRLARSMDRISVLLTLEPSIPKPKLRGTEFPAALLSLWQTSSLIPREHGVGHWRETRFVFIRQLSHVLSTLLTFATDTVHSGAVQPSHSASLHTTARPPYPPYASDVCDNLSVQGLGYELHEMGFNYRQRQEMFLFSKKSRPALGPTQRFFLWKVSDRVVKLTTHLHPVPR